MANSLTALVSQMQNHLSGGLRGQHSYTYSLEQLADEFIQKRGEVLRWLESQGRPVPLTSASQSLDGLVLQPKDWVAMSKAGQELLAHLPVPAHRLAWHHCRIPRLLDLQEPPVVYLGPAGRPENWSVTHDPSDLEFQAFRRVERRAPLCYIDGNDLWVTLRDGRLPQLLRMVAVFADPREPFKLGLSQEEHRILENADVDQTDDAQLALPRFPLDDETAEKARLRVINLFLGTHGTRPINPNDGTAPI